MMILATPERQVQDSARRTSHDSRSGLLCIYPVTASRGLIELTQESTTIGRNANCDIVLSGDSTADQHAVIEWVDGECWIRDCGSAVGTSINDLRISAQRLTAGDRVRIGNCIFKFLSADRLDIQYYNAVYEMMTVDALTGAQNPRSFEEDFAREVLRAQRHWRPIALLRFEIDQFRCIAERQGRMVGNECLHGLSRRVGGRIRGEDLFARLSDEQFALSLVEAPLKQSVRVAQDLRRLVEGEPILTSRGPVPVTISIGIGFANGQGPVTAPEILQKAQENLARARTSGRNCVCY
ncbi:MAG: GGDEF domain-containing protein [Planctomycetaceae bacterium]|nr:GGDEF domain-containing protein [Planctomycetaceae bacterium]